MKNIFGGILILIAGFLIGAASQATFMAKQHSKTYWYLTIVQAVLFAILGAMYVSDVPFLTKKEAPDFDFEKKEEEEEE